MRGLAFHYRVAVLDRVAFELHEDPRERSLQLRPEPARGALAGRAAQLRTKTLTDAFAAFAIAFWAGAVFPVTGSGLGVVDAVLIAALIELSSVSDDVLVAAALLWRVFYSIIPLAPGAITLSRFHKANPDALRRGTAQTT